MTGPSATRVGPWWHLTTLLRDPSWVEVRPGLFVAARSSTIFVRGSTAADTRLHLDVQVNSDGAAVSEARVEPRRTPPRLMSSDFMDVQIPAMTDIAVAAAIRLTGFEGEKLIGSVTKSNVALVRRALRHRGQMVDPTLIAHVARVYTANVATAPQKAVQDAWDVSPSTAKRWIARARKEGLIGDEVRPPRGRRQDQQP